ncbi:hypothetical protein E2C01_075205 [Portunus trituberculatus]|uniref:Uncharacterized protein n=1 Tax=Portunus trituberculatus TaxID=210409 RepID=A0A5B7IA59_PORTR|nr:hypothetical protein [Portunus trituberculatus]
MEEAGGVMRAGRGTNCSGEGDIYSESSRKRLSQSVTPRRTSKRPEGETEAGGRKVKGDLLGRSQGSGLRVAGQRMEWREGESFKNELDEVSKDTYLPLLLRPHCTKLSSSSYPYSVQCKS